MKTANIAGALFVVGLLISGNLAVGGVQPANVVLTAASSPTSLFLAEVTSPEAATLLSAASNTLAGTVIVKTLSVAINDRDGLRSRYSVVVLKEAKARGNATNLLPFGTSPRSAGSLYGAIKLFDAADTLALSGEKYLDGRQVAHSLFRYDSIKAPDIPCI